MAQREGHATWNSKVQGLMLGLALGDATGSQLGVVPETGTLRAGCASQLAAWTAEGMLRNTTRFGGSILWFFDGQPVPGAIFGSYLQWGINRGLSVDGDRTQSVPRRFVDPAARGWLAQVPAMAKLRGSSPSTLHALKVGEAVKGGGCQALLRVLPIAVAIGPDDRGGFVPSPMENRAASVSDYARMVAGLTHDDPDLRASVDVAALTLTASLRSAGSVQDAVRWALGQRRDSVMVEIFEDVIEQSVSRPGAVEVLQRLAPDRAARSALLGGMYVALSFRDPGEVAGALEFARRAPHAHSVATVAGAMLGASHGVESLPVGPVSRLELNWVMQRLADDLALQTTTNQSWQFMTDDAPLDPFWSMKYPGD